MRNEGNIDLISNINVISNNHLEKRGAQRSKCPAAHPSLLVNTCMEK